MRFPPRKTTRSPARQQLLLGALVGVSMLAITGLYAFTLRYQDFEARPEETASPRWSVLADGVITRAAPIKTTLLDVRSTLSAIAQAQREQSATIAAMKARIKNGPLPAVSATETPETL